MQSEKKNKRILVICPHPENVAPGQRLKYEQYFESWRSNAYEVEVSPFMTMNFWNMVYQPGKFHLKALYTLLGYFIRIKDLFRLRKYDAIYVFLWVTPFGFPVFEWLYNAVSKRIIYDIDDMVFLGHVSEANKFILKLKGRSKMIFLMKKAKHIITCTPRLDEFVRQFNSNTTDISSTINTIEYQAKTNYEISGPIVLGWSGSHSTSKYLHLLAPLIQSLSKKYPIELKVIGDRNFKMKDVVVRAQDWKRDTEVKDLSEICIGLYPLPNEDWVYGKSGLKALQYMALGIPTVATDIGANKRIIENGKNSFLVNSLSDWEEIIEKLIESKELREFIGRNARDKVEKEFSIIANENTYLEILKENT